MPVAESRTSEPRTSRIRPQVVLVDLEALPARPRAGGPGRATPTARPIVVATAAPASPISGNGPRPKISSGSSTRLQAFAIQSERIAIAGSPAPRKIALMRKSRRTKTLPPNMIRVKLGSATTSGGASMSASSSGANHAPTIAIGMETTIPSRIDCTAARAAPSGFFSPMRRATIAVAPMPSPMPSA